MHACQMQSTLFYELPHNVLLLGYCMLDVHCMPCHGYRMISVVSVNPKDLVRRFRLLYRVSYKVCDMACCVHITQEAALTITT